MYNAIYMLKLIYIMSYNMSISGQKKYGGVLLSHTVASKVPSALKGLTSVFGMGTGVSPSL